MCIRVCTSILACLNVCLHGCIYVQVCMYVCMCVCCHRHSAASLPLSGKSFSRSCKPSAPRALAAECSRPACRCPTHLVPEPKYSGEPGIASHFEERAQRATRNARSEHFEERALASDEKSESVYCVQSPSLFVFQSALGPVSWSIQFTPVRTCACTAPTTDARRIVDDD